MKITIPEKYGTGQLKVTVNSKDVWVPIGVETEVTDAVAAAVAALLKSLEETVYPYKEPVEDQIEEIWNAYSEQSTLRDEVVAAAATASEASATAKQVLDSVPSDYTELSNTVSELSDESVAIAELIGTDIRKNLFVADDTAVSETNYSYTIVNYPNRTRVTVNGTMKDDSGSSILFRVNSTVDGLEVGKNYRVTITPISGTTDKIVSIYLSPMSIGNRTGAKFYSLSVDDTNNHVAGSADFEATVAVSALYLNINSGATLDNLVLDIAVYDLDDGYYEPTGKLDETVVVGKGNLSEELSAFVDNSTSKTVSVHDYNVLNVDRLNSSISYHVFGNGYAEQRKELLSSGKTKKYGDLKIIIISDSHVDSPEISAAGTRWSDAETMGNCFRSMASWVNKQTDIDFCLHLGDVTHATLEEDPDGTQVDTFRKLIKPIAVPLYEIIGNHDIGQSAVFTDHGSILCNGVHIATFNTEDTWNPTGFDYAADAFAATSKYRIMATHKSYVKASDSRKESAKLYSENTGFSLWLSGHTHTNPWVSTECLDDSSSLLFTEFNCGSMLNDQFGVLSIDDGIATMTVRKCTDPDTVEQTMTATLRSCI